jgi:hypothetical protein
MPRRGLSARIRKIQKATGGVIERLEERRLLTTWTGGGMAANGEPIFNNFFYSDETGDPVRVSIGGNVTLEAIFFDQDTNTLVNAFPRGTADGADLFQVYVASADINAVISITGINSTTSNPEPFSGTFGGFGVVPANGRPGTQPTAAAQPQGGSILLGGLTAPGAVGEAVIKRNLGGAAFGVRPGGLDDLPSDPGNDLSAGLVAAPGQSIGKFLFGGTVFGKVDVPGSMNMFYAGWLLTGDARGASEGNGTIAQAGQPVSPFLDGIPHSLTEVGFPVVPRGNFHIGGNLQQLVTAGAIGWDGTFGVGFDDATFPFFLSGTDIVVEGRLGQVLSLNGQTAPIQVVNKSTVIDPSIVQEETEGEGGVNFTPRGNVTFGTFPTGVLRELTTGADISPFNNDTSATAQFLGAFDSPLGGNTIVVRGSIAHLRAVNPDELDFYGVALMAGQTITVQLVGQGAAHVGVFDPDGRLIASDYDNAVSIGNLDGTGVITGPVGDTGFQPVVNRPFQFTADRPGIYRFAIGQEGNIDFVPNPTNIRSIVTETYELRIAGVGDLAFGGERSNNAIIDTVAAQSAVLVNSGDAGGIDSGTGFWSSVFKTRINQATDPRRPQFDQNRLQPSFAVVDGNLRALDTDLIGKGTTTLLLLGSGPDFLLLTGSVGLVRSRTGIAYLNPSGQVQPNPFGVGRNYQVVQAGTNLFGSVVANGAIGIIRTGADIGGLGGQVFITADANNSGADGFIDLIDVTGTLGGPAISHGPGGNVRYIRVGGDVTLDPLFSGGTPPRSVHGFNQTVQLTDDSGSVLTFTPLGQALPNPAFDPTAAAGSPASYPTIGPSLTTMVYPIRSGGVVVIDVESSGGLAITATGGTTAEVSRVEVHGAGVTPERFTNPGTRELDVRTPLAFNPTTQTLEVRIGGTAIVDVGYIGVLAAEDQTVLRRNSTVTAFAGASAISNGTGGEIVSINALSIGTLFSAGTLGLARTSIPGNAINFREDIRSGSAYAGPRATAPPASTNEQPTNPAQGALPRAVTNATSAGSVFPFNRQTFGIVVDGDIVSARANMGLGNFLVNGIIGDLVANADGIDVPGVFEGINAPVWAWSPVTQPGATDGGSFVRIQIGEGVLPSGTGALARSGIFADNYIGTVVNQGAGSDLRGDIVFQRKLFNVTLRDGSIIDADILQLPTGVRTVDGRTSSEFESSREGNSGGFVIPGGFPSSGTRRDFQVGNISVTGAGVIIGLTMDFASMNSLSSSNGIFTTGWSTVGNSVVNKVTTGGWGIRSSIFRAGNSLGSVVAAGNGSLLPTTAASASVRQSESAPVDPNFGVAFDPFSGAELNIHNDIHRYFGTSASIPAIAGVTDTGVIEDLFANAQRDLGSITAHTIRARQVSAFNDPNDPTSTASPVFPSQLVFGASIGTIKTTGLINGLRVTTGRIKTFQPGTDVLALNMTVAGPISNVRINGSLGNNSTIFATGPFGNIGNITIARDLFGTIRSSGRMGNVTIGGNVVGTIQVDGTARGAALSNLKIGGGVQNGSIIVNGSIGTIDTALGLGLSTADTIRVTGNLNRLRVGRVIPGGLQANLVVLGSLGSLEVNGPVNGTVTVGTLNNRLTNMTVNGDVNGDVTVNGQLTRATVNGNLNANVTVSENITSFTINNGSFAPNKTLQSTSGSIRSLAVRGGNLFGSVLAPAGTIGTITVDGNLGNGVDALTIATNALNLLSVGASILRLATVRINGPIGTLQVGGNIEQGAAIVATQIGRQTAGSVADGTIVITG